MSTWAATYVKATYIVLDFKSQVYWSNKRKVIFDKVCNILNPNVSQREMQNSRYPISQYVNGFAYQKTKSEIAFEAIQ